MLTFYYYEFPVLEIYLHVPTGADSCLSFVLFRIFFFSVVRVGWERSSRSFFIQRERRSGID